ncbi:extended synaptotagmin-1-like isoform X2 [Oscarella lobularis]|uniref:extended synaptotagmin-1-like isoform X2 n=1 Tax=Oscarella lobularis TaxID=121494 RepID=UPI003313EE4C
MLSFTERALLQQRMATVPAALRWLLAVLAVVLGSFVGIYDSLPSHWLLLLVLLLLGASYLGGGSAKPFPFRRSRHKDGDDEEEEDEGLARAGLEGESCEWLNHLLRCWWSEKQDVLFDLIKEHVEPLLNSAPPTVVESVELIQVDLRRYSPRFDAVAVTSFLEPEGDPSTTRGKVRDFFKRITAQNRVTITANLAWNCPQSHVAFRIRLGSKNIGLSTIVKVESFNLSGPVEFTLSSSSSTALSTISLSFLHQPECWFSIKAFRCLNLTHIPLLKSWLYTKINWTINRLMVAPGKLDIDLMPKSRPILPVSTGPITGVLTVSCSGSRGSLTHFNCYSSIQVENQKYKSRILMGDASWHVTHSFLISNSKLDKVIFKVKSKSLNWSQLLALDCFSLGQLKFSDTPSEVKKIRRNVSSSLCDIELELEFTHLGSPGDIATMASPATFIASRVSSGVLTLFLHSGKDLSYGQTCPFEFYSCAVIANKKLVLLSNDAPCRRSVEWNSQQDFLTVNYSSSITIVLCGKRRKLSLHEPIACTVLTIHEGDYFVKERVLQFHSLSSDSLPSGTISVSLLFRPVESVKQSELALEEQMTDPMVKEFMLHTAWRLQEKETDRYATFASSSSPQKNRPSSGLIDITVHQARDLLPRSAGGFGDPYVEIKLNHHRLFATKCIQNSINPVWDESVTIEMLQPGASLVLECWDKQMLQDESLGRLRLTLDHIKMHQDTPAEWFPLEGSASGKLQLSCKISPVIETDASSISSIGRRILSPLAESSPFRPERDSSDSDEADGDNNRILPKTHSWTTELPSQKQPEDRGFRKIPTLSGSFRGSFRGAKTEHHFERRPSIASSNSSRQTTMFYGLSGTVLHATGLKGEIEKLKLYVKVRLNSRPSSQRSRLEKYTRGPVIHKTRSVRGSNTPEWMETFQVKESGVPNDSLLTVDLKSDSRIQIGTHSVTLEKFFDGQNQARKWLGIGNEAKLELLMSCQTSPLPSPPPKIKRKLSLRKS